MSSRSWQYLLLIILLIGVSLSVFAEMAGNKKLKDSIQQRKQVERLEHELQRRVFDKITLYLANGNVLQLNQAKNALIELMDTGVHSFFQENTPAVMKPLEAYLTFLNIDLLSAGKAAGNRSMLLDHNFDEISFQIERLQRYVDAARSQHKGYIMQYDLACANFRELLMQREMKRNAYFVNFSPEDLKHMLRLNNYMIDIAKELDRFPLLGIQERTEKTAPDLADLLGVEQTAELPHEMGDEVKKKLHGLLVHFPVDVENTQKIYAAQKATATKAEELTQTVKSALYNQKSRFDASVQENVKSWRFSYFSLLIITSILIIQFVVSHTKFKY